MTGTWSLVRFVLRRDRLALPLWVGAIAVYALGQAASLDAAYPTAADRATLARTIEGNITYAALYGPPRALETAGGLLGWRITTITATFAALMSLMLVTRHTRAEEERGRTELLGATAVGRFAATTAAVVVVAAADLALGAIIALGLLGEGLPTAGSLALGAAVCATGLVFAGVATVTAQLTAYSRAANGLAGAVLGLAFLLRASGDAGDGTLSWLSPIGWGQALRPFAGERWWPLLLPLTATPLLLAGAYALLSGRDVGAGLIAERPGPPRAARLLTHPLGLALRLQRAGLLAWSTALFGGGLVLGALGQSADDLVKSGKVASDLFTQAGGGDVVDAFFASIMVLMALFASAFAIQSALRLRGEETTGRAEPVLAAAVSRVRWVASHVALALGGSVVTLGAAGLGLGCAHAIGSGNLSQIPRLVAAALVQLPAVWVLTSLATALFGVAPRATAAAWAALGACFLLWVLGPIADAPGWLMDLSPYTHVPALPAADFSAGPLLALLAVAAAITAAGVAGVKRRDVGS